MPSVGWNRLQLARQMMRLVLVGKSGMMRQAYCPSEPSWEEHACGNALRAFRGILHDQGLTT